MSSSGLKLTVRYALPPSQLGFCGPQEEQNQKLLIGFAKGHKIPQSKVRRVLERFEAMYPYLRLIAECNGVADPFDERVVKAFWVGNELLDNVSAEDLRRLVTTDFSGPCLLSTEEAERRASQVKEGMVPHHSFHVLFLGSITGRVKFDLALRDLCRIGWGRVVKMTDRKLKVSHKPLISDRDGKLMLGEEVEKEIEWDEEMVPGVRKGDRVSFHWGRVCDILNEEDVSNLEHYTKKTLSLLTTG
jgi:hypothetical protein